VSSGSGSLSRYILVRILLIIPMLWVVLTMVFFMLRVAPGTKAGLAARATRRTGVGAFESL